MYRIFEINQIIKMHLVIDIGNTNVKAAVFEKHTLVKNFVFQETDFLLALENITKEFNIYNVILSSVSSISEKELEKLKKRIDLMVLSTKTNVPFKNLYKTPKTLGLDRVALVSNAVLKYPNTNVLVIDAGTCITYDFVTKNAEYLGGAISPGLKMRYKSLKKFTAKLPLIEGEIVTNFVGKNTKESINIGVTYGILKEIEAFITSYKEKYEHLTVVLTGGDTNFLSKQLKSSIFANQNFLLEGLNEILIFNLNK